MSVDAGSSERFVARNVSLLGTTAPVDIEVQDRFIVAIRRSATTSLTRLIALPGLVDLHTHLREPGKEAAETIATGTRAAAAGGYTDVFAMANTTPVTDSVETVEALRLRAIEASARVHPVSAATLGREGRALVDVEALRAVGVTVFSDDGDCVESDGLVFELLQRVAESGGVFAQHAQSSSIVGGGVASELVAEEFGCGAWPAAGEEAVVARDIALARATGGRAHICHASTSRTVELLTWAKRMRAKVTAEVTPHHLALTDADAVRRGAALKVNPPLRPREDVLALRAALRDGVIDSVGTDHAPHPLISKELSWSAAAFGMTGIETALPVVAEVLTNADGTVDWPRLVDVMSTTPARIGQLLEPPSLRVGARADFCVVEEGGPWLVDPAEQYSKSCNAAFAGCSFRHRVVLTVLAGLPVHTL